MPRFFPAFPQGYLDLDSRTAVRESLDQLDLRGFYNNDVSIRFKIIEAEKRPVAAVADQFEVREVSTVDVSLDRSRCLTLLFDPEHALDERIAMEQFAHWNRAGGRVLKGLARRRQAEAQVYASG